MAINSLSTGFRPGVCTSGTRPTAPYIGQHIYETDTLLEYVWNGSIWVRIYTAPTTTKGDIDTYSTAPARLPVGTNNQILTANSATTTGLEWQNNTSGLVLISTTSFTNQPTPTLNNLFSSTYDNYRIVYRISVSGTAYLRAQLTSSGTPVTSNYVHKTLWTDTNIPSATIGNYDQASTAFAMGPLGTSTDGPLSGTMDLFCPFVSSISTQCANAGAGLYQAVAFYTVWGGGFQRNANSYDGLRFFASAGNITGTVTCYGYRA